MLTELAVLVAHPGRPFLNISAALEDGEPFDYLKERATGRAIVAPGTIAGLEAMWRRFGALPWVDLWQPAAYFARAGFQLHPNYWWNMRRREDVLLRTPEGRAILAPNGRPLHLGPFPAQPAAAGGRLTCHGAATRSRPRGGQPP